MVTAVHAREEKIKVCNKRAKERKKKQREREGKSEAKRGVVRWGLGSFSQVWSWQQQEKGDFVCLQEITFLCLTTYASKYVSSKFNTKYINKLIIIIMIPELIVPNSKFPFPIGNLSTTTYSASPNFFTFSKLKTTFSHRKRKTNFTFQRFFFPKLSTRNLDSITLKI